MKLKFIKNVLSNKKKSSFLSVVIVLYLNYRPNSAQIDSDIRGISAHKNFGLSL